MRTLKIRKGEIYDLVSKLKAAVVKACERASLELLHHCMCVCVCVCVCERERERERERENTTVKHTVGELFFFR